MSFPLENLPPELLPHIYEHMSFKNQAALRSASKKYYSQCRDFPDGKIVYAFIETIKKIPKAIKEDKKLLSESRYKNSYLFYGTHILPSTGILSMFSLTCEFKNNGNLSELLWAYADTKLSSIKVTYLSENISKIQFNCLVAALEIMNKKLLKRSSWRYIPLYNRPYINF